MRLLVGAVVDRLGRHPFDYRSGWFRPRAFEPSLYKKLRIKSWKGRMPTYEPKKFSREYYTMEEIVRNMCVAEVCHEVIVLFSFLPILLAIPFGTLPVFLITSVLAALLDTAFVIMQRFNRPRLVRILDYKRTV